MEGDEALVLLQKRSAIDRDERTVEDCRLQRIALERGWSSRLLGTLYVYAALRDCQQVIKTTLAQRQKLLRASFQS